MKFDLTGVRLRRVLVDCAATFALAGCGGGGGGSPVTVVSGSGAIPPTPEPTATPTPTPTPTATPTPAPAPTPTPTATPSTSLHGVVAEGDSISNYVPGAYTYAYAAANPSVEFHGTAVPGSSISDLGTRLPAVLALHPALVTVLIGANDLGNSNPAADWLTGLWSYVALLKASGAKVAVATVLPVAEPANATAFQQAVVRYHAAKRPVVNAAIRAAVGIKFDAVIDFAADPDIGPDAAAADKRWYGDGTHPTIEGQERLATIYAPVVNRMLAR